MKLIPHDPYVVSNYINIPVAPPKQNIVSRTVKAMMRKFRPEPELVEMTITQTVQLAEPLEEFKLSDEDIRRMSKMLEDRFMREMLGPYACSEWEESLRAAGTKF